MAADADIDETLSLARLLAAHGVRLTSTSDSEDRGLCSLHLEPSELRVDIEAGTWSCAACGVSRGDAALWLMKAEGVSRRHAREMLRAGKLALERRGAGPKEGIAPKQTTVREMDLPFAADDPDDAILSGVADFYHRALLRSAEAKRYLEARGLRHPRLAERMQLGLGDKTLGLHIPIANRKLGRAVRARLQALGVLRARSGHEALTACLVVPLFDLEGHLINLYGRLLDRPQRGSSKHVFTDPTRTGLIHPSALGGAELVVTASILDALTCLSHGIEHVSAVHGLDGPRELLLEGLKASGKVQRIVLCFRRTKAADVAATELAQAIAPLGIAVHQGLLPHDLDINEYLATTADPEHALRQVLRSAPWLAGVAASAEKSAPLPRRTAVPAETKVLEDEIVRGFEDRRWRVRGLAECTSPAVMRVNILVSREDIGFHVDTFDVYSARHRVAFIRQASTDLGLDEALIRKDMGALLLELEQAQSELLRERQAPRRTQVELTAEARHEALALLRDPKLLARVLDAFEAMGIAGERDNLTLAFLATISRKLARPLGVILQSSSAAGKSSLLHAALSLVPEEDRASYSAMTGQSLFYAAAENLKHKVLAIAEEEGASEASYSLKLLQSEGSISIASTGKDPTSGRLVSHEYRVEGPVALLLTSSSLELDEELTNRSITLTIDESPEQTRRIHERQRRAQTLAGVIAAHDQGALLRLHQNAQRLLRPLTVVNPHADQLGYADLRVRARRDFRKLLSLVEAVTLLHQHQRAVKTVEHGGAVVEYIEATRDDVELAERLFRKLGSAPLHDLPPQSLAVLQLVTRFVRDQDRRDVRFSRRELRDALGLGDTQAKVHLRRLADAELLVVHRAPTGKGVVYELAYTCDAYAFDAERSASGRPSVGPRSGLGRPAVGPLESSQSASLAKAFDARAGSQREERTSLDDSGAADGEGDRVLDAARKRSA